MPGDGSRPSRPGSDRDLASQLRHGGVVVLAQVTGDKAQVGLGSGQVGVAEEGLDVGIRGLEASAVWRGLGPP